MYANEYYQVSTDVYQGPLDLLLDLIQKAELDITKLSLAAVTDQYLQHIEKLVELSAADVSAFIIIAAKLLQIKSEALLPRPPSREEGEEDPGESLTRQLRIYKAMKDTAAFLSQRSSAGYRTYLRLSVPPKINETLDMTGIDLKALLQSLVDMFESGQPLIPISTMMMIPTVTIKQKIKYILNQLETNPLLSFRELLNQPNSRIESIVVFLALLELVKQNYVVASQSANFSDIVIESAENIEFNQDIDLMIDD